MVDCPEGTEEEIRSLGLEIELELPLQCHVEDLQTLEDEEVEKVTAYYASADCAYFQETTFIVSKDGNFQPIYKHLIKDYWEMEKYATEQLKTPVGNVGSNFWLKRKTKWALTKRNESYCYAEFLKFPFEGALYSCPSQKKPTEYEISGEVSYMNGLFQWRDAYEKAVLECPKYGDAECYVSKSWDIKQDFPWFYRADSWMIYNEAKDQIVAYLFTMPIKRDPEATRHDGVLLIKVEESGRVQSQEIESVAYDEADALALADKLFSDKN